MDEWMNVEIENNVRIIIRAKNNLLLEKREALGYTQLQMADHCDVSLGIYSNAERLQHIPFAQAEKIAFIFEIKLEELFPNWLELFGDLVNNKNNYLIMDNSYIEKRLVNNEAFGGQNLLKESFHTDLDRALNNLSTKESEVIRMYFGLNGEVPLTLDEIGERVLLTKERVRQIKERALRRLRHLESNILRKYLGDEIN